MIGTGPGEVVQVTLRFDDHQMHIDGLCRRFPYGFDHDRPDRDVRHEAPVHDINMDPVSARGVHRPHLIGQPAEIG